MFMQSSISPMQSTTTTRKAGVPCAAAGSSNSSLSGGSSGGSSGSSTSTNGTKRNPSWAIASARPVTVILNQQQAEKVRNGEMMFDAVNKVAREGGNALTATSPAHVFDCPEESLFYSQCIEKMVLSRHDTPTQLIEFGAGDGSPVISVLLKTAPHNKQHMTIHAYEIGTSAAAIAAQRAAMYGLEQHYQVHNSCFWNGVKETPASCLIANPPYLPAPDDDLLMPALWGGIDGAVLTRDLLSLGFDQTMLMISAYSNPVLTLQHAQQQEYAVRDFLVTPLPFGTYSREPKVKQWIEAMRGRGEAFFSPCMYFLAGVLFEKKQSAATVGAQSDGGGRLSAAPDLHDELLQVLTAL